MLLGNASRASLAEAQKRDFDAIVKIVGQLNPPSTKVEGFSARRLKPTGADITVQL